MPSTLLNSMTLLDTPEGNPPIRNGASCLPESSGRALIAGRIREYQRRPTTEERDGRRICRASPPTQAPLCSGQHFQWHPPPKNQSARASGGFTRRNSQGFTVWTETVGSVILEADGKRKAETNARDCHLLLTPCQASHEGPAPRTDMDSRAAFSRLGLFRMRMDVQTFGAAGRQLIPGNEGELPSIAR
jgi:hypothetical protein